MTSLHLPVPEVQGVPAPSPGGPVSKLKVSPYHSVRLHRNDRVYHDRADCPTGKLIHSEALAKGTGVLRRCDQCRALDDRAGAE